MINAYAQEVQQAASGQGISPGNTYIIMLVVLFAIWYVLLIRPQKKSQEEHKKMISQLKKNDEVITSGGIHGTIANVKENTVVMKVDDNVKIEVQKNLVSTLKKSR